MIPIAAVLLIIVVVFSVGLVVGNPNASLISIFRAQISMNPAGVYFTGAGAMLVLILALGLLRVGLRRSMSKRKEIRKLRHAAGAQALPKGGGAKASPSAATTRTSSAASESAASSAKAAPASAVTEPAPSADTAPAGSDSAAGPISSVSGPTSAKVPTAGDQVRPARQPTAATTEAERQALLDEADELTGDDPVR